MIDLATPAARPAFDGASFPVFVLDGDGRMLDANAAACAYFHQTRQQLCGVDALGARGYSPERRAAFRKRFDAWLAGELNPFVLAWPLGADGEKFLVIPQHVFHGGRPSVALVLIPAQLISTAIGEPSRTASAGVGLGSFQREKDGELAKLTRREWEVARRLAEGDRVPLIVEDLGIAENTVRNHLKAIFRKLGVGSQAELIRRIKRPPGVAGQR
ncbi:MAG TPA: LuxR C-terminal-related transcriptional regulator [Myxococcota bacterium]|nr:LuxR C-terminal-related transcriptional regulator [Myxococcota bacterium]